jgi:drug/metabolite transporter (DMT)-like permease
MTTPVPAAGGKEEAARLAGVALIVFAYLCFACLDTTAKYLGAALAPLQIVWVRFLTHSAFATAALRPWRRPEHYRMRHPLQQAVRALCLLGATFFNFLAVQYLQLAETAAIFFLAPFVVTALAGPFLGEWAGARRWVAIIVGFLGALLIVRPGPEGFQPAMLLSLAATASYAFYILLTRRLTRDETAEGMILLPALIAAAIMTPIGLLHWQPVPGALHWALLLSTGLFGGLGHWFVIKAHETAPAPVLAPFLYTQLLWMVLLGYAVFGDIPGRSTLVGAAIIVASGLYLFYRESQLAARRRRAAAP